MAKDNNLVDFLNDLADGIRVRSGETGLIKAQDMRATIEGLTKPMEIDTEAEMNEILENATVGGVYKYVGETGIYEQDAIYIVSEVK